MNENFRFRESFRGYNRDDVNAYIEQINIAFSRKETDLRAYISELERSSSNIVTPNDSSVENNRLKEQLAKANEEIERLKNELMAINQVPSEHSQDLEKSKLYDSMSAQVGNILIVANNNADKILAEANLAAERVRAEAKADAEKIIFEAESKKDSMIKQFDDRLKMIADSCILEYANLLSEAQTRFEGVNQTMKLEAEKILSVVDEKSEALESKIFDDYGNSSQVIEG